MSEEIEKTEESIDTAQEPAIETEESVAEMDVQVPPSDFNSQPAVDQPVSKETKPGAAEGIGAIAGGVDKEPTALDRDNQLGLICSPLVPWVVSFCWHSGRAARPQVSSKIRESRRQGSVLVCHTEG